MREMLLGALLAAGPAAADVGVSGPADASTFGEKKPTARPIS
jgi:hypothetical protein